MRETFSDLQSLVLMMMKWKGVTASQQHVVTQMTFDGFLGRILKAQISRLYWKRRIYSKPIEVESVSGCCATCRLCELLFLVVKSLSRLHELKIWRTHTYCVSLLVIIVVRFREELGKTINEAYWKCVDVIRICVVMSRSFHACNLKQHRYTLYLRSIMFPGHISQSYTNNHKLSTFVKLISRTHLSHPRTTCMIMIR